MPDCDIYVTCEECARPVRAIEMEDHVCEQEDLNIDRVRQYKQVYD